MLRGFFVALLVAALGAIGLERFIQDAPTAAQQPVEQEDTFHSTEGGDGWPPPPPPSGP